MKKSVLVISILFITGIILSSFLVSAAPQTLSGLAKSFIDGTVELVKPYLGALLNESDASATSEMFMAKLIFAIVLISIIYVVLGRTMENLFAERQWALWIVSIGITLVGIRFLSSEFIYTMILPSNALAVALASIIPFVIYFAIVEGVFTNAGIRSQTARRVAWVFFAVVFLGLYTLRQSDLGNFAWIYPLTALLAIIVMLLDGTIQGILEDMRVDRAGASRREELMRDAMRELQRVDEDLSHGIITDAEHARLSRRYRARIHELRRR